MKRFENFTLYPRINEAIKDAEKLLSYNSPMMLELKSKNDFKFNSGTGEEVFEKLYRSLPFVGIFTYKSKLPWSKAVGFFERGNIYINTRKISGLTHTDLVGLLVHEYSHHAGLGHGNNFKTEEKCLYSVPYFLSEGVSRWL